MHLLVRYKFIYSVTVVCSENNHHPTQSGPGLVAKEYFAHLVVEETKCNLQVTTFLIPLAVVMSQTIEFGTWASSH